MIWSPAARGELRSIYRYIAEKNPQAAALFVNDMDRKFRSFAKSGLTGVARDELSPGLRAWPYRDRCIYFRVRDNALVILRILHGHQNITPDDFPESEI